MRRATVQTGFYANFAHAQFLMIEAEAVKNLRRPVDHMDAIAIRWSLRCALYSSVCAQWGGVFKRLISQDCVSHTSKAMFLLSMTNTATREFMNAVAEV